ncbi:MAG: 3-hydroxyacyl-[acyl-carrier-protein] dehydratase FabZ [Candidatus Tectomicrobia bacterium RIFCSPLOWO2_12_FULL_69_37]|nr:MAG: 3-hydroxyacyl-[acyl-carrier-protein] dehydratase FabZ [Candidatus Tectomicrobia bacterium RIFCSPLOWO2_02_FULL_70_19]OGL63545.1 MAG: 3-hydroxyacyl-[acyl-carrier-protein] dehydratase FabZ [Candidatus Tectomicrobia bacterium RIFCSPLOWO2_12_FULL_69_37]
MMGPDEILRLLPHRFPMLMVDRVLELDPQAVSIVAQKNVSHNEPFFAGHFPGRPIMPGVLIIEALAQTGLLCLFALGKVEVGMDFFFGGVERARFRRAVLPGDQIRLEVKLIQSRGNFWKMEGAALIEGETAADAVLTAVTVPRLAAP